VARPPHTSVIPIVCPLAGDPVGNGLVVSLARPGGNITGLSLPLVTNNRIRINNLALGARLPTMHGSREHVEAGGLMSYGPNFPDLFRRSADYVDKILRGAWPGELPVEQPTRIDLVVNLTTAKVLGLTVPTTVLARADEVIE
jgi:putative ABC transport system substrate-binding protein